MSSTETCLTCGHWKPYQERKSSTAWDAAGDCRRRAPLVRMAESYYGGPIDSERTFWPKTQSRDWCGDYERVVEETK